MVSSIEEQIEDLCKRELKNIKYYTKTEGINSEIDNALKIAPSKSGGTGNNYPDIKLFIETKDCRKIPVMIEVKGKKGDLIKLNSNNEIDNYKKDGSVNFNNIKKYAVNGAIHYANAIIQYTESYKEVIAIGVNGYYQDNNLIKELEAYYISKSNLFIPKKITKYTDLSFLLEENRDILLENLNTLLLTKEELEKKKLKLENEIEVCLKNINQKMHDELDIVVGARVKLIAGLIMAGLGVENKVSKLKTEDLKGELGENSNDGKIIINKITDFLNEKHLPKEKRELILHDLSKVFLGSKLEIPINGESKLKTVYTDVKNNILPFLSSDLHNIDFTGRLFNVLNEWVDVPDGDKNDVVLTPRYVTELMAKLAKVNMNSYVWDFATGSAGFLISSMHLMIKDAQDNIKNENKKRQKIAKIKAEQLLGIEKLSDIYLLAVLNMILMGDGSSNIIHKNSLTEYKGLYEQGQLNGEEFPANVFLLNPPYSADGKGFVFVEKALNMMKSGKAVILIQENAGSGQGLPYTKNLLKNNTLLASIHMADIFYGKAGVQTAIYLFDIGIPHNEKQQVKFIDFSNDGYSRQNRKKSSQDVNLKDTDNAKERYDEIVNLVLYGKTYLKYFKEEDYIEDTISLNGDDWTYSQHKKIDITPTEIDFRNTVKEYLAWKVSQVLQGDICG